MVTIVYKTLYFCKALFIFHFQLYSSFSYIINHFFLPACPYAPKTDALLNAETLVFIYQIHFAKSHKTLILSSLSLRKIV